MGFFSWRTSDTNRSIANSYSDRETHTVHMITEDGQVFTEKNYEGYGVFGGKDIYELIAEMNGICLKDEDTDTKRSKAIDLLYKTEITNGERSYTANVDFRMWSEPIKAEGGKTANELCEEGWEKVYPNGYGDFEIAAKNGIKLPKLVEKIPENFSDVPYPTNCPEQGFFYENEDDEDDDDEDWDEDDDEDWDEDDE